VKSSIFLIDASAFVFRAYYAMAPLSSKGRPSHAVAGFASMLLKVLRDKKPAGCVVVFDSKRPSFRKDIFPEYKANREIPPPDLSGQIEAVREMCAKAGLICLQREGIEADDLIASFVKAHRDSQEIVIVSSDKDLTQLVDSKVLLYDSFRERVLGEKEVEEKYGVPPSQMLDFLSLTGDSSDNIPGINGVGPKTAIQILKEGGSIEKILKDPSILSEKFQKKILDSKKELLLSRELVTLKSDCEEGSIEPKPLRFPFPKDFSDFLFDWDCQRILSQYSDLLTSSVEASVDTPKALLESSANLKLAQTQSDLDYLEAEVKKANICVLDFETNSFDRQSSRAVGFSLAWNEAEAWYVPVDHPPSKISGRKLLENLLADRRIRWIAHHWKFDSEVLHREGLPIPESADDTMLEAYILNSDRRSYSLDALSEALLQERKGDLKSLLGKSTNFAEVSLEDAARYAAQDAHLTLLLHRKLREDLSQQKSLEWVYEQLEMPLVPVLANMERLGIKVDPKTLETMSKDLHEKLTNVETKIYAMAGAEFNINSPKQLQTILFEQLKLKATKKTKTGYSTDESVLQELALEHPLPAHLLEFRGLSKLLSTYVDVLPTLVKSDGRIHTQYHQSATATGRLSSSEPNLQNIPVRTEEGLKIRSAFVPEPGFELMSADYSQVELRLFAHMSGDESMIKAFRSGRDIHAETAKIIFGSADKEFRSRAKAINFGIIYGISAFGLSQQLKISRTEAAQFIASYFEKFAQFKGFMESLVETAKKNLMTESLFGRRRPLPDIVSKNPMLRSFAERVSINAPVQGTAADIMKSAMVRIYQELKRRGLKSRILLQVHDELVLEVWSQEKDEVQKLVVFEMEDLSKTPIKKLSVPLIADSGFGKSWAEI